MSCLLILWTGKFKKKAEAGAYLEKQMIRFQEIGLSVESKLMEGQAADNIVLFVHQNNVDLIVLSSHGRSGLSGWNVSSVVQKTNLRAYTSVMIVRAYHPIAPTQEESGYRRLLVPIDGSLRAECVLPYMVCKQKRVYLWQLYYCSHSRLTADIPAVLRHRGGGFNCYSLPFRFREIPQSPFHHIQIRLPQPLQS
jgi:nucleotide-binding universal stress UspA family protein